MMYRDGVILCAEELLFWKLEMFRVLLIGRLLYSFDSTAITVAAGGGTKASNYLITKTMLNELTKNCVEVTIINRGKNNNIFLNMYIGFSWTICDKLEKIK